MSGLELEGFSIAMNGTAVIAGLDLALAPGAVLAIVGRSDAGKTMLAETLAGHRHAGAAVSGRIVLARRLALICAADDMASLPRRLAHHPELIIADEPGATLDPGARRQLLTALLEAARDHRASLLILTRHIRLPLAMDLETAVLSGGAIVELGPAATLADRPRHDATRELLAAERPRTRTLARPPVGENLLEFDGVTQRFRGPPQGWLRRNTPTLALDTVSFVVRRGEAIGILGGAGAGKSTLLRLAAGIGRTNAGGLTLARQPYRGDDLPRESRARMAFVFPDPHAAFNPDLPVGLTLTEPLRVEEQLLVDEQADGLAEAVRAVGFEPDILSRLPATFRPAELQRLALARALVARPHLILLDEPTWVLDPVDEADFLTLFNRIRADFGITILVASRRLAVLRLLVDRIHVLDHGRIVETGTPTQLQQETQHPATQALLASPYPGPLPVIVAEPQPEPAPVPEPQAAESAVQAAVTPAPETRPPADEAPIAASTEESVQPEAMPPLEPAIPPQAPEPPAAEPLPVSPDPVPAPGPAPAVRPLANRPDESAESREAQLAVEGGSNRTRRVETADDESWG